MAKYWGLRGKQLNAAIWLESMWAIIIFGYNQGSAGGVLTTRSFNQQFPAIDTIFTTGTKQHDNSTIQGTVVALYTLFGTFGALSCTFLGDRLGRRWTIFVACFVQGIGCILMGTSFQFAQFIVARIVLGLGTGGIIATVSVWQSELSKATSRGSHVSGFGTFCGIGLSIALWLSFGVSFTDPSSVSWRLPLALPLLFSLIVMAFIFTLPESPRWLIKKNRLDEARDILARIYDVDEDDEIVANDIRDVQTSLELAGTFKLSAMFKMGPQRTFHRVCLACVVQIFLQMSGTNAISYYTTAVFEQQLHYTPTIAKILSASLQAVLILGSIVCSFTVDRFGRRKLMMFSAGMTAINMACLTGCTSSATNTSALKAAVFFIFFFQFCFCIGFLGVPFVYASEIAPVHMRAGVAGVSTAVSWLWNFLVVEVTPVAFTDIGYRYFIVYATFNAAVVPLIYFFFPETSNRSLEELDEIFASSKSIFDVVPNARNLPKRNLIEFLHDEEQRGEKAWREERGGTEVGEAEHVEDVGSKEGDREVKHLED